MLLANALVFVDACPAPTNLQKYLGAREVFKFCFHACCCRTLAVFVLSLDASFLFVIFAIFALGLDSTELLQRHFGTTVFVVSFVSNLPPYLPPHMNAQTQASLVSPPYTSLAPACSQSRLRAETEYALCRRVRSLRQSRLKNCTWAVACCMLPVACCLLRCSAVACCLLRCCMLPRSSSVVCGAALSAGYSAPANQSKCSADCEITTCAEVLGNINQIFAEERGRLMIPHYSNFILEWRKFQRHRQPAKASNVLETSKSTSATMSEARATHSPCSLTPSCRSQIRHFLFHFYGFFVIVPSF
jgi:hypothetical protein